jgi:hypothetical protein
MTKWFMALGGFSFWMLLHWVAGSEFVRGEKMAVSLSVATILAVGGWVFGKLMELNDD